MLSYTIEKLQAAMDLIKDIPPAPFFGSSKEFPADRAMMFTVDRREYVGAHPDFWAKIPVSEGKIGNTPLNGIEIHNLDVSPSRSAEFHGALAKALGDH